MFTFSFKYETTSIPKWSSDYSECSPISILTFSHWEGKPSTKRVWQCNSFRINSSLCKQYLMVDYIFPNIENNYWEVAWLAESWILTTKKFLVKHQIDLDASRIPDPEREFLSADSVRETKLNELNFSVERINNPSGITSLPDHQLCPDNERMVVLLRCVQVKNAQVIEPRYVEYSAEDENKRFFLKSRSQEKQRKTFQYTANFMQSRRRQVTMILQFLDSIKQTFPYVSAFHW